VDDSGNESLAVQDEEQVDDVDDTTLTAENDNGQTHDEYVIYVGQNITSDGGNGSYENPFATLDLACANVSEGKEKVDLNIFNGTYYIGSELRFNTSVLNINGVGSNVILKNLYDTTSAKQSFGLIELNNGKFTMTNIIFDASDWHQKNSKARCFSPFNNGDNNQVNFNNCTFIGFNDNNVILPHSNDELNNYNNYTFTNCKFINFTNQMHMGNAIKCDVSFINCVFSAKFENGIGMEESNSVTFDRCWFGYNDFNDNRMFTNLNPKTGEITPRMGMTNGLYKFTKYAIFDISENYLGDNKFEIIGKLMWNDSTTEDIDKLGLMTVNLNSTTGDLNQTTAILENGIFKVLYTSTSSNNNISAVLDNQKIDLIFTNMDMSLNAPNVSYGEKSNITVTLPQAVYGTVTVLVDGISYPGNIENNNSIIIPITDTLSVGSHNVNVTFIDEENHIYAFNTTTITVNKVSNYDFNATVTPTVYLGDNATVTLSLPDGATGNVTVKVGENAAKLFDINDIISINGFVAGNNTVNITFISDNYETKSIVKYVTASTKPTTITANNVTTDYKVAKDLVVTLTDANGNPLANKTINIVVGKINEYLNTSADGKVSIDISTLDPDTYVASISFAGDELYNSSSTTATVVVKADIKTDITIPEITAGKATTTTIKLPEKATGNITLTVDGKIVSVVNLTNGSATITIPELTAGKHDVVISYSGDGNYAAFSQNSTVTVKEAAKPTPAPAPVKKAKQATKIVAKNKKFKAKTKVKKYTITLKTKAGKAVKKVQVTIKIGKKTYKAKTNNKGKATFKIKKLTKKAKYTATIKFKGNANYKATTKKVKITIK
jgi:hypothetical protein